MKGEDAIRRKVLAIERECLLCKQVNGYGVTRKCIQYQHIEWLAVFPADGKSRIAENDIRLRRRFAQISEEFSRHAFHQWIKLIKPQHVSRLTVGGQRSRSKAYNAYPFGAACTTKTEREAYP